MDAPAPDELVPASPGSASHTAREATPRALRTPAASASERNLGLLGACGRGRNVSCGKVRDWAMRGPSDAQGYPGEDRYRGPAAPGRGDNRWGLARSPEERRAEHERRLGILPVA